MHDFVMIQVVNCKQCPHCVKERTVGAGYAEDYLCKASPVPKEVRHPYGYKVIAGYVEWPSQEPKDHQIPAWCPFWKLPQEVAHG